MFAMFFLKMPEIQLKFPEDGILGLSLDGLAMNKNFSTLDMLGKPGRVVVWLDVKLVIHIT